MRKVKGFTLIEAMIALTIAGGAAATFTKINLDSFLIQFLQALFKRH